MSMVANRRSVVCLLLTFVMAALFAAACGSGSSSDTTTASGSDTTTASGSGESEGSGGSSQAVPPPPGATEKSNDSGYDGFKLYTTSDSPEQVDDYYAKAFEKAGWQGGTTTGGDMGGGAYNDGASNFATVQAEKTGSDTTFSICFADQADLTKCGDAEQKVWNSIRDGEY